MQAKEGVIIFPMYGSNYDVAGGPDVNQLLAALKDSKVTVTFTFIGYENDDKNGAQITHDVEVQVNSATPIDIERVVFNVAGSVVTPDGWGERFTVREYNTETTHGAGAGIFL